MNSKSNSHLNINSKKIEFETYQKPYRIMSEGELLEDYYTLYNSVEEIIKEDEVLQGIYTDPTTAIINLFFMIQSLGYRKLQYNHITTRVYNLQFQTLEDRIEFLNSIVKDELKDLLVISSLQHTTMLMHQMKRYTKALKKFNRTHSKEDLKDICLLNIFSSIRKTIAQTANIILEFNKELKQFAKTIRSNKSLDEFCQEIEKEYKDKI
jgi:hypothetical protein